MTTIRFASILVLLLAWVSILSASASTSDFDEPERFLQKSPDSVLQWAVPAGEKVLDLDVSALGPEAAVLIQSSHQSQKVLFWDLLSREAKAWELPKGFQAKSIAWHPAKRAFFLLGKEGRSHAIMSVVNQSGNWSGKTIFKTDKTLRRLVVGPRPFVTGTKVNTEEFRLYFGQADSGKDYSLQTITESGRVQYQVIGKKSGLPVVEADADIAASDMVAKSALPLGFHPAGDLMVWENSQGCFELAEYGEKAWGRILPLVGGTLCGGSVSVTPNGVWLIHWLPGHDGVETIGFKGKNRTMRAKDYRFDFTPSSVPDGKGLVGLTHRDGKPFLVYVPIDIPLADVANAWMFVESEDDLGRFVRSGGLMRHTDFLQMYNLYDTENYSCGGYSSMVPTRPYYVTTDAFWEVFAAAFEALFVVTEKQTAIPAFWNFVDAGARYFTSQPRPSHWKTVFSVLRDYHRNIVDPEGETKRIDAAGGNIFSPLYGRKLAYGELKPRGNYASNPEFQKYFKAFTYLTKTALAPGEMNGVEKDPFRELESVPASLKEKAQAWIAPYHIFIAAARFPSAWSPESFKSPVYLKNGVTGRAMFPLSWGMDNEILNSVVYHTGWPDSERISSAKGERMMASVLDFPAGLGNALALKEVQGEINDYPKLDGVLADLSRRAWRDSADGGSLYNGWLRAIATQWSNSPKLPSNPLDWQSWDAKRLQTGLATWTTLRHATVLVNETSAAECGEGGFEEIVLKPPRGYVEPDPATFAAMAGLFRFAADKLRHQTQLTGLIPSDTGYKGEPLRQGLTRKLEESAAIAENFSRMAGKELRGEALADSDYTEILYVGRFAEHHFLLYKSVSNQGLGLAVPDPIAKIADVAHGPAGAPYLHAAVGQPLEWDQVVPYFGRREIVKGPVYSFYEFQSDKLYNDKEWQQSLASHHQPAWISPYITQRPLSCPAQKPF